MCVYIKPCKYIGACFILVTLYIIHMYCTFSIHYISEIIDMSKMTVRVICLHKFCMNSTQIAPICLVKQCDICSDIVTGLNLYIKTEFAYPFEVNS